MRDRLTLIVGLLCTLLLLVGSVQAAPIRLVPEPDTTNTTSLQTFSPSFGVRNFANQLLLGSSSIVVAFDSEPHTLRFESVSIQLGPATVVWGARFFYSFTDMTFRLPEGAAPPQVRTGGAGAFTTSFPVTLDYRYFSCSPFCGPPFSGSQTTAWDVSGTFTTDELSGRTRLKDLTVLVRPGALADGAMNLNFWDGFGIFESRKYQRVGDKITLVGNDITPGSILKILLNTPAGALDVLPEGLAPTATTPTTWEGVLPWPWPVPAPDDVQLGYGFMYAFLVRTDRGFDQSNGITRMLVGNDALGVPGIERLGFSSLAASSWELEVARGNVEDLLFTGQTTTIGGSFAGQDPVVIVFSADADDCTPDGGIVPTGRGDTFIDFKIPAKCSTGTAAFQVVNRNNYQVSNLVYAALGDVIRVNSVTLLGRTVQVTGTGFSRFTTLNLFATQQGTGNVINFGGKLPNDEPRIPLTSVTPTSLTFQLPPDAAAGPAFVEAMNPPFIPFTSSRARSEAGAFTIL